MKKKIKFIFAILLTTLFCSQNIFANGDQESAKEKVIVLRLAEVHVEGYPTADGNAAFARLVEEKTDGRIRVDCYFGGQLGGEKSYIEQLQMGSLDFARVSAGPMALFSDNMGVYSFPYLFKDADHFRKVLGGEIGKKLFSELEDSGFYGITYFDAGSRDFYSKTPVQNMVDLKGLKIRSMQNEICIAGINATGASAVPMAFTELYSAMQQGVVDGAENNPPTYLTQSHYEVAPYYIHDAHVRIPDVLIGSKIVMDKLSAEDRQAIFEAGVEAAVIQQEKWDIYVEKAIEEATAKGATFFTPDAKFFNDMRAASSVVYDTYGEDYKEIIESIQAVE